MQIKFNSAVKKVLRDILKPTENPNQDVVEAVQCFLGKWDVIMQELFDKKKRQFMAEHPGVLAEDVCHANDGHSILVSLDPQVPHFDSDGQDEGFFLLYLTDGALSTRVSTFLDQKLDELRKAFQVHMDERPVLERFVERLIRQQVNDGKEIIGANVHGEVASIFQGLQSFLANSAPVVEAMFPTRSNGIALFFESFGAYGPLIHAGSADLDVASSQAGKPYDSTDFSAFIGDLECTATRLVGFMQVYKTGKKPAENRSYHPGFLGHYFNSAELLLQALQEYQAPFNILMHFHPDDGFGSPLSQGVPMSFVDTCQQALEMNDRAGALDLLQKNITCNIERFDLSVIKAASVRCFVASLTDGEKKTIYAAVLSTFGKSWDTLIMPTRSQSSTSGRMESDETDDSADECTVVRRELRSKSTATSAASASQAVVPARGKKRATVVPASRSAPAAAKLGRPDHDQTDFKVDPTTVLTLLQAQSMFACLQALDLTSAISGDDLQNLKRCLVNVTPQGMAGLRTMCMQLTHQVAEAQDAGIENDEVVEIFHCACGTKCHPDHDAEELVRCNNECTSSGVACWQWMHVACKNDIHSGLCVFCRNAVAEQESVMANIGTSMRPGLMVQDTKVPTEKDIEHALIKVLTLLHNEPLGWKTDSAQAYNAQFDDARLRSSTQDVLKLPPVLRLLQKWTRPLPEFIRLHVMPNVTHNVTLAQTPRPDGPHMYLCTRTDRSRTGTHNDAVTLAANPMIPRASEHDQWVLDVMSRCLEVHWTPTVVVHRPLVGQEAMGVGLQFAAKLAGSADSSRSLVSSSGDDESDDDDEDDSDAADELELHELEKGVVLVEYASIAQYAKAIPPYHARTAKEEGMYDCTLAQAEGPDGLWPDDLEVRLTPYAEMFAARRPVGTIALLANCADAARKANANMVPLVDKDDCVRLILVTSKKVKHNEQVYWAYRLKGVTPARRTGHKNSHFVDCQSIQQQPLEP